MIDNNNYKSIITIDPNKHGGRPCIRNMRISVYDVLHILFSGMEEDINAFLKFAAEREIQL